MPAYFYMSTKCLIRLVDVCKWVERTNSACKPQRLDLSIYGNEHFGGFKTSIFLSFDCEHRPRRSLQICVICIHIHLLLKKINTKVLKYQIRFLFTTYIHFKQGHVLARTQNIFTRWMNECIHIRLLNAPMRPAYWSRYQFSVKEQYWIPNIHVNALLENSKQEMIKL